MEPVQYIFCHADPEVHLANRAAQLIGLGCSPEYVSSVIEDIRPRLVQVGRR